MGYGGSGPNHQPQNQGRTYSQDNGTKRVRFTTSPSGPKGNRQGNAAQIDKDDFRCHFCGEIGHYARNCFAKTRQMKAQREAQQAAQQHQQQQQPRNLGYFQVQAGNPNYACDEPTGDDYPPSVFAMNHWATKKSGN